MDNGSAEDVYEMVGSFSVPKRSNLADLNPTCRLNTKIASRDLEVKDLVKDLSDGVSSHLARLKRIYC